MTTHTISTTITRSRGGEDYEYPVEVTITLTEPDPSVGIYDYGYEDLRCIKADGDGEEVELTEQQEEELGEEALENYSKSEPFFYSRNQRRQAPSEYYD